MSLKKLKADLTQVEEKELESAKENEDREIEAQKNGIVRGKGFSFKYSGPLKKQKYSGPRPKKKVEDFPDKLPLEPLRSDEKQNKRFYVRPVFFEKQTTLLLEMKKVDESKFTEQQKKWRNQALKKEDLNQELGKKVKSHNRLGLWRYIFFNNVIYSINGLLYYLIPLTANIIFLLYNLHIFAFIENVAFATVMIIPVALTVITHKSKNNAFVKFLLYLLIVFFTILSINIFAQYYPEIYEKIYYPYAIKIFLIYFGFYWFGKYYVIWHIMYVQDLLSDFGNVVKVKAGKPRVGKTSQGVQEAKAEALQMWRKLQYDFWLWHSREEEILKRGDINELLEWYAIKESYLFYTREPKPGKKKGIPCLWSNIGIEDGSGRASYQVTLSNIRGTSRLPLYSAVFFDEIGAVLKNELSNKKSEYYDVSDMFRLGGHFLKWAVICCEQDPKNIYIDCRRVVGSNEIIESQQWVCKPTLALSIFEFLKTWKIDELDKGSKRQANFAKFMDRFEKYVKSIGFRRQIVSTIGNLETGSRVYVTSEGAERIPLGKKRIRYVASGINKYYNDRAYKQLYPSYFLSKIEGETFDDLVINGFNLDEASQFVSSTEQLCAIRQALTDKIKEIA